MGKKLNQAEFEKRAKQIHGVRYDYKKSKYIDSKTLVTIICKCGPFEQSPNKHLSGRGCPKCAIKKRADAQRLTIEEFKERAKQIHGDRYNYDNSEYNGAHTKIKIRCKCGPFEQTPNAHLRGQGCPTCAGNQKLDTDSFKERAKEIHGDLYNYNESVYNGYDNKITISCKCGPFEQTPNKHLMGHGCPTCAIERGADALRLTIEEFKERAKQIHGDRYNYDNSEYINSHTPVTIRCIKCKKDFEQRPGDHLRGQGCSYCINKTEQKLMQILATKYPNIQSQLKINWCKNPSTNRCLPFDFYILIYKVIIEPYKHIQWIPYNIIIELDGRQHFEQTSNWDDPISIQKRDRYKMKSALENGYSVIRLKQEDVWNDTFDWFQDIQNTIQRIMNSNQPDIYTLTKYTDNSYDWIYVNDDWIPTELDMIEL